MRAITIRQRKRVEQHIQQHKLRCSACGGQLEGVGKVILPLHAAFDPAQLRGLPEGQYDLAVVLLACRECRMCLFLDLPDLST